MIDVENITQDQVELSLEEKAMLLHDLVGLALTKLVEAGADIPLESVTKLVLSQSEGGLSLSLELSEGEPLVAEVVDAEIEAALTEALGEGMD